MGIRSPHFTRSRQLRTNKHILLGMRAEGGLQTAPLRRSRPERDLLLVANGKASGVAGGERLAEAVETLRAHGARVEPRVTSDLHQLEAAIAEADGRVVLLGGDGTVHAVANLTGPLPELALLPAGRANNIARSLGIPLEIDRAAALAIDGSARPIDAIDARAGDRTYRVVEGVSVGFHARARVKYHAENSAALWEGVAAGLSTLWKFRPQKVVIESNGEREVMTIAQLFASNLQLYGFGMRVAREANPADGELDLVTIDVRTRRSLVSMLPHVRRGTHLDLPGVRTWRASHVRIDPGGASPVIADSTDLGVGPVDLTVARGALQVVTP
jgi:diacylglycerol kinase (ATP)